MIQITPQQAYEIGNAIGVDWRYVDLEQLRRGIIVELEHGLRDPQTNVINDDLYLSGKIALAHLKELPDYYTRLEAMENAAVYPPPIMPAYSNTTLCWGGVAAGALVTGFMIARSGAKTKKKGVEGKE